MKRQHAYRVKEVAQTTGISVRALHHYDQIGLLVPKERTTAGYRLYDQDDLLRLQQVLIGRELGLSLKEIRRSLDDPRFDRRKSLLTQRQQLQTRANQMAEMIRAVDTALSLLDEGSGDHMDNTKQLFEGFNPAKYEAEAKERWGETDSYKVSVKRTSSYTPDDWKAIQTEQASIYGDAFADLQAGKAADSIEVMAIAERHRLSLDRWFYPCSFAMHADLADGYEADSRFAETIDKFGAGLTPFLSAAIRANTRTRGG